MDKTEQLQALATEKSAILHGDAQRVAKQHKDGKCTARERMGKLLDAGSFVELDALREDSHVICGSGTVNGQAVYCFAQDYTSLGGAMTIAQVEKILKLLRMARMTGAPVVAMLDSAGVKITEGPAALPLYAKLTAALARLSGVCPLIACVMGPCTGLSTLLTQACDIAIQVKKTGEIALHTALVMNSEKGKEKTGEQLFGADTMAQQGACALAAENEDEAIALIATLVDLLPASNVEDAPINLDADLNRLMVSDDADEAAPLLSDLCDDHRVIELNAAFGTAVKTALARIGGRSCGIVATDAKVDGGRLDANACRKAARFVRFCDCFHLPIISLVNTQGLSVPCACGQGNLIKAAAALAFAYAEATAPKLAILTGNAVGAAFVAMGGKDIADVCYAWPTAMVAPLTREVAVQAMEADKLLGGENRTDLEEAYAARCGALAAAKAGIVDDVIDPKETRKYLIAAMELLASKHDTTLPKKHGNLPL